MSIMIVNQESQLALSQKATALICRIDNATDFEEASTLVDESVALWEENQESLKVILSKQDEIGMQFVKLTTMRLDKNHNPEEYQAKSKVVNEAAQAVKALADKQKEVSQDISNIMTYARSKMIDLMGK